MQTNPRHCEEQRADQPMAPRGTEYRPPCTKGQICPPPHPGAPKTENRTSQTSSYRSIRITEV